METDNDTVRTEAILNRPLQTPGDSEDAADRRGAAGVHAAAGVSNSASEVQLGDLDSRLPTISMSPGEERSVLQGSASAPILSDVNVPNQEEAIKNNSDGSPQEMLRTTPPDLKTDGMVTNEVFEEFINSPRGQNAIVERSPEGRYVRFMEKLGSGASKDVYRAYDTTEGIEVAWNVVQLNGVPKTERNRIVNEVRLLERLHHPNIISFHGSWVNRERQEVNFVTEILSSGTLTSFIEKVQVIRWKIAKRWAFQILKGLEYLHSQDPPVIHRDLKCENIFINGTSGDLRIGDLGLSTVHRTDKALSVLGTPEFMAPDLYEESAYDEKVDVYAFGMCLLEILTKEIPYKECSNAAQIYKKVTLGEKPESLSRLRSKMARDFIVLCLGEKDPVSGKYVRPSVSELLTHNFLAKNPDDDSEVIVDLPLLRREIAEEHASMKSQDTITSADIQTVEEQVHLPVTRRKEESHEVDDSDQFEDMPDSESNIRKVKVLMGRNEELKEENHLLTNQASPLQQFPSDTESAQLPTPQQAIYESSVPLSGSNTVGHVTTDDQNGVLQGQQLIFAATVIEDHAAAMPHYQDELLKLIIKLPVQGQTQNVQFSFHLVEDDPVEVAKEMVAELGIPHDAVLEIGGTISALARQARIKQGHFRRQQQAVQGNDSHTFPVGVVSEAQLPAAYQPHSSAQGLQSLQVIDTIPQAYPPRSMVQVLQPLHVVGAQSQIGANVTLPVACSRPLSQTMVATRLPTPPHGVQFPVSASDQMQGLLHLSNSTATNDSPRPHQTQRKSSAASDLQSVMSDLAVQDQSVFPTENSASRAIESPFGIGIVKDESGDDQEDSVSEELRRLDEDFQKNFVRAQKVFDSRMDNLQRSKLEKEELHKKTLQKHEKEKIEFERRLQQEEIEQSLRLEKMQREWEIQRQLIEESKRNKANSASDEISWRQGIGTRPSSQTSSQEFTIHNSSQPGEE